MTVPATFALRMVRLVGRLAHLRSRARMFVTSGWDQVFRSLRSKEENRVLKVGFELTVHIGRGENNPAPAPVTVAAWAQVRVKTAELAAVHAGTFDTPRGSAAGTVVSPAADAVSAPTAGSSTSAAGAAWAAVSTAPVGRWWSPGLDAAGRVVAGKDFGVGFGRVTGVSGWLGSMTRWCPRWCGMGIPQAALGPVGVGPWAALQGLSVTGNEMSGPGVADRNWRELVDFLSHRSFVHLIDDLTGADGQQPGIVVTLQHPRDTNRRVTLGVEGSTTGTADADYTDDRMPINVLFSTGDWFHGRPLDRETERQLQVTLKGPTPSQEGTAVAGPGPVRVMWWPRREFGRPAMAAVAQPALPATDTGLRVSGRHHGDDLRPD